MVRCTFIGGLSDTLSVPECNTNRNYGSVADLRGNSDSIFELRSDTIADHNNNKAIAIQQCSKLYSLCKENSLQCIKWVGKNSLQVYLVHGFSLCLLASNMQVTANQFPVNAFIA